MSHTTIKAVWPGEGTDDLGGLRNAWGSAPAVWGALGKRYLDSEGAVFHRNGADIWALAKRQDIPRSTRAVLVMTFDKAIIMRKDYAQAADDIEDAIHQLGMAKSHWPRIADLLRSNPECPAIGFHWTSVTEDPFQGDWNEDADQHDPPDWSKFWSVYEHASLSPGVDASAGSP